MINVVGIKFIKENSYGGKVYNFSAGNLKIKTGMRLVVETPRGEEIVEAVTDSNMVDESKVSHEIKSIIRIVTKEDEDNYIKNKRDEKSVIKKVKEMALETNPEMHIIDCKYTLKREQLIVFFISDGRVDFREIVKKIAAKYRTRIEMRQVGVRDEAKVIGGVGICGRIICCNSYLSDFATISINMAKNQSLSLVPSKISGVCGRLLCCLTYEDEEYKLLKVGLPKLGSKYETSEGVGKVIQLNVLKRTFKVLHKDKGIVTEVDLNGSNE